MLFWILLFILVFEYSGDYPVGFYPMTLCAEGYDFSDHGNDGQAFYVTYNDLPSMADNAMTFSSDDTYFLIEESSTLDTEYHITIIVHILPSSNGSVISYGGYDGSLVNQKLGLEIVDESLVFKVVSRDSSVEVMLQYDDLEMNTLSYVAASYDYNTGVAKLYVNNNEVATENIALADGSIPTLATDDDIYVSFNDVY